MGMYDQRCMVTGLPLTDEATAVLLAPVGDGYRPVTLGIHGMYNRYGTIDGIDEDLNTDLVWTYAVERLADNRLVVGAGYLLNPTDTIDDFLELVERNQLYFLADNPAEFKPALTLDGALIHYALIHQPVWDALSAGADQDEGPVDGLFERLFGESTIAKEIYRGRLADVAAQVRQLAAITDFLTAQGMTWAPPGEQHQRYPSDLGAQYYAEDLRYFVAEARRDAGSVEVLRAAIDEADRIATERETEELRRQEQIDDEVKRQAAEQPAENETSSQWVLNLTPIPIHRGIVVDSKDDAIE